MSNYDKLLRRALIEAQPEAYIYDELERVGNELEEINRTLADLPIKELEKLLTLIPEKGVDYFTDAEAEEFGQYILNLATPVKGRDYFDGEMGPQGPAGKDGMGKPGKDGKDGSPDTPHAIAEKLNMLEGAIEAKVIAGIPTLADITDHLKNLKGKERIDFGTKADVAFKKNLYKGQYLHGAGIISLIAGAGISVSNDGLGNWTISATGSTGTFLTERPTGTFDGVNTVFTLSQTPVAMSLQLFLNGQYQTAGASYDYQQVGTTITFNSAPSALYQTLPFIAQYSY